MVTLILTAHLSHLCIIMKTKNIVKASLFTLILAFVVATVAATGGVMKNREVIEAPKADPVDVNALSDKADDLPTWFYTGGPEDDPTNPDNYSPNEDPNKPCGLPEQTVCKIKASADSLGRPSMNEPVGGSTVKQQIIDAIGSLSTPTPSTNATVESFRPHN